MTQYHRFVWSQMEKWIAHILQMLRVNIYLWGNLIASLSKSLFLCMKFNAYWSFVGWTEQQEWCFWRILAAYRSAVLFNEQTWYCRAYQRVCSTDFMMIYGKYLYGNCNEAPRHRFKNGKLSARVSSCLSACVKWLYEAFYTPSKYLIALWSVNIHFLPHRLNSRQTFAHMHVPRMLDRQSHHSNTLHWRYLLLPHRCVLHQSKSCKSHMNDG